MTRRNAGTVTRRAAGLMVIIGDRMLGLVTDEDGVAYWRACAFRLGELVSGPIFACIGVLAASALAAAQEPHGELRVHRPEDPWMDRVVIAGDSVLFWSRYDRDGPAYVFDRRSRTFGRIAAPTGPRAREHASVVPAGLDEFTLVDSIRLATVRLPDGTPSWVVRVGSARTIALRGPLVTAEQAWRAARGLRPTPPSPPTDGLPPSVVSPATDRAPVIVRSFMIDEQSIWLGIASGNPQEYGEFALGGVLRIDRRNRIVEVMRDSLVFHADVLQLVRGNGDHLILLTRTPGSAAGAALITFNTTSRTARRLSIPEPFVANEIAVAGDTVFAAGGTHIAVVDVATGRAQQRTFKLLLSGDSVLHALADTPVTPDWDLLGAVGLARELGIAEVPFARAAAGVLRAVGLVYYAPGDRFTVTTRIVGGSADADSALAAHDTLLGPYEIIVDRLDHPALRPFLREALRRGDFDLHYKIADIVIATRDSASIPDLRGALARDETAGAAWTASALAVLGDATGVSWIRAALADTVRSGAPSGPNARIHHYVFEAAGRAQDPANVPRLLHLMHEARYTADAVDALLDYRDPSAWEQCAGVVVRDSLGAAARWMLYRVLRDTVVAMSAPAVRDSVRRLARTVLAGNDTASMDVAADVLGRYGAVDNLPALIALLDQDASSYRRAVLAWSVSPAPATRQCRAARVHSPNGKRHARGGRPGMNARAQPSVQRRATLRPPPGSECGIGLAALSHAERHFRLAIGRNAGLVGASARLHRFVPPRSGTQLWSRGDEVSSKVDSAARQQRSTNTVAPIRRVGDGAVSGRGGAWNHRCRATERWVNGAPSALWRRFRRTRMNRYLIMLSVLAAGAACAGDALAPGTQHKLEAVSAEVTAIRIPGGIRVTNGTNQALAYFAYNPGLTALWATCVDPGAACIRLSAGASATVNEADVAGYAPGVAVVEVYFYRVVPDGNGAYREAPIRSVTVRM